MVQTILHHLFQDKNQEIEQPQITDSKEIRNKLLVQTAGSYQKTLTESKISEALPHMYKQKGVIDLEIPEILILGFTEEEENELLQRYIDQPSQKTGDQALQIMNEIVTLDKDITSNIARNFQHWSDRFSSQAVPLSKLTTKTSRFILDTEIMRQRNKLQMTMEKATHWYTTLNHTQLAEIVTRLWNDDTDNSKRMTLDEAIDDFVIDIYSPEMDIKSLRAEKKKLSELHSLLIKYGTKETDTKEKQESYFKKLIKKIDKKSPYFLKMEELFNNQREEFPRNTVKDWIKCFAQVRETARTVIAQAAYFGANPEYKRQDKNKRNETNNEKNTAFNLNKDSTKEQKNQQSFKNKINRFNEKKNCRRCGWWTHQALDCKSKILTAMRTKQYLLIGQLRGSSGCKIRSTDHSYMPV
jgi:hypothetical protein